MSISVKNGSGDWVQCAGRGRAEYGASTVRTGTATITTSSTVGGAVVKNVTFNSPMPDATYEVTLTLGGEGNDSTATVVYNTKTANGFTIRLTTLHSAASGKSVTIGYTAFKLYTDTEYNQVLDNVDYLTTASNGISGYTLPMQRITKNTCKRYTMALYFPHTHFIGDLYLFNTATTGEESTVIYNTVVTKVAGGYEASDITVTATWTNDNIMTFNVNAPAEVSSAWFSA